jgi:hypothetical protein
MSVAEGSREDGRNGLVTGVLFKSANVNPPGRGVHEYRMFPALVERGYGGH